MHIDLSVQIKRNTESQNYQLNMLVINATNTGAIETNICQTLTFDREPDLLYNLGNNILFILYDER